ncbi:MAG: hypothetical protein LAO05_13670 [Acidobacteriia bacterium]|nr:hypothetical protein [Terriglobia bacterium]
MIGVRGLQTSRDAALPYPARGGGSSASQCAGRGAAGDLRGDAPELAMVRVERIGGGGKLAPWGEPDGRRP